MKKVVEASGEHPRRRGLHTCIAGHRIHRTLLWKDGKYQEMLYKKIGVKW
jgi:hypothetical protein